MREVLKVLDQKLEQGNLLLLREELQDKIQAD